MLMQSYTPPTYEDLSVKSETEETPESHILHVHIPDGFSRDQIGAKVEYDFERVRIYGERPLGNNRRSRFNEVYQVPAYCDISKIRGKFDGRIVTITMIKIPELFQKFQQEETQATQQKENTPPQPAIKPEDSKATQENPQKDTITKVESEKRTSHETSTTPEEKSIPPQKATVTADAKLQTEEKFTGKDNENKEKESIAKEETKDQPKEAAESGKPPEKAAAVNDSPATKESRKEESKGPATVGSFSPEKDKGKEINGKFIGNDAADKKIDKSSVSVPESTTIRTRIKEIADSTSQVVTSLVKRINEEDKQKLIYMGAAVVVVTLGVYASYKFRSSRRT